VGFGQRRWEEWREFVRARTAVVLDADAQLGVDQIRRDGYGLLAIDGYFGIFGGAVGGARADAQDVLLVEGHVGG
jgi:hypothetical protein